MKLHTPYKIMLDFGKVIKEKVKMQNIFRE